MVTTCSSTSTATSLACWWRRPRPIPPGLADLDLPQLPLVPLVGLYPLLRIRLQGRKRTRRPHSVTVMPCCGWRPEEDDA